MQERANQRNKEQQTGQRHFENSQNHFNHLLPFRQQPMIYPFGYQGRETSLTPIPPRPMFQRGGVPPPPAPIQQYNPSLHRRVSVNSLCQPNSNKNAKFLARDNDPQVQVNSSDMYTIEQIRKFKEKDGRNKLSKKNVHAAKKQQKERRGRPCEVNPAKKLTPQGIQEFDAKRQEQHQQDKQQKLEKKKSHEQIIQKAHNDDDSEDDMGGGVLGAFDMFGGGRMKKPDQSPLQGFLGRSPPSNMAVPQLGQNHSLVGFGMPQMRQPMPPFMQQHKFKGGQFMPPFFGGMGNPGPPPPFFSTMPEKSVKDDNSTRMLSEKSHSLVPVQAPLLNINSNMMNSQFHHHQDPRPMQPTQMMPWGVEGPPIQQVISMHEEPAPRQFEPKHPNYFDRNQTLVSWFVSQPGPSQSYLQEPLAKQNFDVRKVKGAPEMQVGGPFSWFNNRKTPLHQSHGSTEPTYLNSKQLRRILKVREKKRAKMHEILSKQKLTSGSVIPLMSQSHIRKKCKARTSAARNRERDPGGMFSSKNSKSLAIKKDQKKLLPKKKKVVSPTIESKPQ